MNSISLNETALLLLQPGTTAVGSTASATDRILSIVSGMSKADTAAGVTSISSDTKASTTTGNAREAGGSISSELSPYQLSIMGQIAAGTTLAQAPSADSAWDKLSKGVETVIASAASAIAHYNGKFNLLAMPSREQYNAEIEQSRLYQLGRGVSEEAANAKAALYLTDQAYANRISQYEAINNNLVTLSHHAENGLVNIKSRIALDITYDDTGKAKMAAFDVKDGAGRMIASYGDDGSLTLFQEDGSIGKIFSDRDIRGMGYY